MDKTTRNILITCGVILAVACLCITAVVVGGAGLFMINQRTVSDPTAVVDLPTPMPTLPAEAESGLDAEIAEEMDLIQSQVIALRGLEPSSAVPRTLLSEAQLRENVMNDFLSDYTPEDAQKDSAVLSLLGLLPEGFELIDFYTELYSEQIAGYYDDEAKAMFVVQGTKFAGFEKMTYAHEYVHVLQDQTYDLSDGLGFNEESCEEDSERCAAVQALIEGDATVTEFEWFQKYATPEDYKDVLDFYDSYASPVFDSAPYYMQADFMFPYEKGQAFVQYLMEKGKYRAVDAAFRDVPVSTEQILHPEKYPEDTPIAVDLPDLTQTLGKDWEEFDRNVMGEWYTYLILSSAYEEDFRLETDTAYDAAEGWGGDTYLIYHNAKTDELVFIMRSAFDSTRDLDEFQFALRDYADLRWGASDKDTLGSFFWEGRDAFSAIYIEGDLVTWIIAPDQDTYRLIKSNLP